MNHATALEDKSLEPTAVAIEALGTQQTFESALRCPGTELDVFDKIIGPTI